MSVVSVHPTWSDPTGSSNLSEDLNRLSISFSQGYLIQATAGTNQAEVLFHMNSLLLGASHPNVPGAVCRSVNVSSANSPILWKATAAYNGESGITGEHPVFAAPEMSETDVESSEEVQFDYFGRPILNANNEPLEGITMAFTDTVLNVRKNMFAFDSYVRRLYRRATNSDTFNGWPPGTARFSRLDVTKVGTGAGQYVTVDAQIQFREPVFTTPDKAWYVRSRHEGYTERIGAVTVTVTGGGSGVVASAIVGPDGKVAGVNVLKGGSGFASPPTVSFTATAGSGAAATATVENGAVTKIVMTNGGSGYKSKIVKATDDRGQPMSRPVLLNPDGTRLYNSDQAFWMEIPVYGSLPFNALGLLS